MREAVLSTRSEKSHAYSHRICAITAQKDSSGCGARRMANLYCSLNCSIPVEQEQTLTFEKNKTPQGTGVFLLFINLLLRVGRR